MPRHPPCALKRLPIQTLNKHNKDTLQNHTQTHTLNPPTNKRPCAGQMLASTIHFTNNKRTTSRPPRRAQPTIGSSRHLMSQGPTVCQTNPTTRTPHVPRTPHKREHSTSTRPHQQDQSSSTVPLVNTTSPPTRTVEVLRVCSLERR